MKGDSIMAFKFSEAMDPSSFTLGVGLGPTASDTVDIRYRNLSPNPNANNPTGNLIGGVEGNSIPGTFTRDPSAKIYYFKPLFSFGSGLSNFDFAIQVFQGLKDLSGNSLVNPRSFGPYVCDGTGIPIGKTLVEGFDIVVDRDATPALNTADWGVTVPSELQGAAITTKLAIISGWRETVEARMPVSTTASIDPLIGDEDQQLRDGPQPADQPGPPR